MPSFRAVKRFARVLRRERSSADGPEPFDPERVDSWLEQFYGEQLNTIDAALAAGPQEPYALFGDLDDDAWGLLLTQRYELYPHIRAVLPDVPEPAFQELWNGTSGVALAGQSTAFYSRLRMAYRRHGPRQLAESSVLDFGCGWGRLTRYLLRDVAPGRLYGCDPVEGILDVCRANRVPAQLARSEFRPQRVPFEARFDLAFAFSVFTHLSEAAHDDCLAALHGSLNPGGILLVTIRPPAYLSVSAALREAAGRLDLAEPRYLFVPHPADPGHPQQQPDGPMDYGETMFTMAYVRQHWSRWFELLDSGVQLQDPHQAVLTLRRR